MTQYALSHAFNQAREDAAAQILILEAVAPEIDTEEDKIGAISRDIAALQTRRATEQVARNNAQVQIAQARKILDDPGVPESKKGVLRDTIVQENEKRDRAEEALTEIDKKIDAAQRRLKPHHEIHLKKSKAKRDAKKKLVQCIKTFLAEYKLADEKIIADLRDHLVETDPTATGETTEASAFSAGKIRIDGSSGQANTLADVKSLLVETPELEHQIQMILEHLTARRIAEEMDTPTYLFRLSAFYQRAQNRAEMLETQTVHLMTNVLGVERTMLMGLKEAILVEIGLAAPFLRTSLVEGFIARSEKIHRDMDTALRLILLACQDIGLRLKRFNEDLCGSKNLGDVRTVVKKVSDQIEKGAGLRIWPWLTALVATSAAGVVMIGHQSPFLAGLTSQIFVLIFVVILLSSYRFGYRFRANIMRSVKRGQREGMKALFAPSLDDDALFTLAPVMLGQKQNLARSLVPKKSWSVGRHRFRMICENFGLAAATTLVASLVTLAGPGAPYLSKSGAMVALSGVTPQGQVCLVATGELVRSNRLHHFVLPHADVPHPWRARLFPSLYADAIDREYVKTIVQYGPDTDTPPIYCKDLGGPEKTTLAVTSDVLVTPKITVSAAAQSETDTILTTRLEALTEKINAIKFPERPPMVFVTLPGMQPAQETADAALWVYRVVHDNRLVFEAANSLLLLFFPIEIKDTDNDVTFAFQKGLEAIPAKSDGEPFEQGLQFYLARLARLIERQLAEGVVSVTLDVRGYASERWRGVDRAEQRNELNYALAEGRRFAVIAWLANEINKTLTKDVWIMGAGGCRRLSDFGDPRTPVDYRSFPAFVDYQDLDNNRNILMQEHQVNKEDVFRDFTQRSVWVRLYPGGTPCKGGELALEKDVLATDVGSSLSGLPGDASPLPGVVDVSTQESE